MICRIISAGATLGAIEFEKYCRPAEGGLVAKLQETISPCEGHHFLRDRFMRGH
jgi:hypothetical protein